jgi:hypothetical protein
MRPSLAHTLPRNDARLIADFLRDEPLWSLVKAIVKLRWWKLKGIKV